MIAPARGWPSWLIACTGMETDWARSGGADETIAIVSSISVTPIRRSKGARQAIVGTSDGNRPPPRFPLFDYPRVSAIRNVSLQYGFHVTPDAVLTLLRKPALADLDIQGTESAGISRHIVGMQEPYRKGEATPFWPRVLRWTEFRGPVADNSPKLQGRGKTAGRSEFPRS